MWVVALCLIAAPAEAATLEVESPGPLILGDLETVGVQIHADETAETEGRPLRVSVNVGSFDPVERVSPGVYHTTYHLPDTRFPQVALVAVWRETGPEATIDFQRIPLFARTEIPVGAKPGAEVTVLVGEAQFGPVITPARGEVKVPIVVPPGVNEVTVVSQRGNKKAQANVPARVPPYNRLTLALTPHRVPADGQSSATVHLYYDADQLPPAQDFVLEGGRGKATPLRSEAQRQIFRFVPERATSASEVRITAKLKSDRTSFAEASLSLGVPEAETVVPRKLEGTLIADGKSTVNVSALVSDRFGLGIEHLPAQASVDLGAVVGQEEKGGGEYVFKLRAPDAYPKNGRVDLKLIFERAGREPLLASIGVAVAAAPVATQVELRTEPEAPSADAPFKLVLVAKNEASELLAGADLALEVSGGKAGALRDLGGGRYEADVDPDAGADKAAIRVTARGGKAELVREVPYSASSASLLIGALGAASMGGAHPFFGLGLELGWRLPIADRRLALALRASYESSLTLDLRGQVPAGVPFAGRPITGSGFTRNMVGMFGVHYDFVVDQPWRVYAGAALGLVRSAHASSAAVEGGPVSSSKAARVAPGVEARFGASFHGVFLEAIGRFAPSSVDAGDGNRFDASPIRVGVALGYRLGVL